MALPNEATKPVSRCAPSPKSRKIQRQKTEELEARLAELDYQIKELGEVRIVLQEDRDQLRFQTAIDTQKAFQAVLKAIEKLDGEKKKMEAERKVVQCELATRTRATIH